MVLLVVAAGRQVRKRGAQVPLGIPIEGPFARETSPLAKELQGHPLAASERWRRSAMDWRGRQGGRGVRCTPCWSHASRRSAWRGVGRAEGRAVPRHDLDEPRDAQDARTAGMQRGRVRRVRILDRRVGAPPQVCEGDHAGAGAHQRRDVLGRVARRLDQPDRGGDEEALRAPPLPQVAFVDRPMVVEAGVGKEGRVEGVIGVVMGEHHIGDRGGRFAEICAASSSALRPGFTALRKASSPNEAKTRFSPVSGTASAMVAMATTFMNESSNLF